MAERIPNYLELRLFQGHPDLPIFRPLTKEYNDEIFVQHANKHIFRKDPANDIWYYEGRVPIRSLEAKKQRLLDLLHDFVASILKNVKLQRQEGGREAQWREAIAELENLKVRLQKERSAVNLTSLDLEILLSVITLCAVDEDCGACTRRGRSCRECRWKDDECTKLDFCIALRAMKPANNAIEMFQLLDDYHCFEVRKLWKDFIQPFACMTLDVISKEVIPWLRNLAYVHEPLLPYDALKSKDFADCVFYYVHEGFQGLTAPSDTLISDFIDPLVEKDGDETATDKEQTGDDEDIASPEDYLDIERKTKTSTRKQKLPVTGWFKLPTTTAMLVTLRGEKSLQSESTVSLEVTEGNSNALQIGNNLDSDTTVTTATDESQQREQLPSLIVPKGSPDELQPKDTQNNETTMTTQTEKTRQRECTHSPEKNLTSNDPSNAQIDEIQERDYLQSRWIKIRTPVTAPMPLRDRTPKFEPNSKRKRKTRLVASASKILRMDNMVDGLPGALLETSEHLQPKRGKRSSQEILAALKASGSHFLSEEQQHELKNGSSINSTGVFPSNGTPETTRLMITEGRQKKDPRKKNNSSLQILDRLKASGSPFLNDE